MGLSHTTAPGIGLGIDMNDAIVFNRTGGALVLGNVVQFDMTEAQSETATSGGWRCNVTTPSALSATVPGVGGGVNATTLGQPGAIFGIVADLLADAGADNKLVRVVVKGRVGVLPASGATLTKGRGIFPASTTLTATNTLVNGTKCIGFADATSAGNGLITACTVDGYNGFGAAHVDLII